MPDEKIKSRLPDNLFKRIVIIIAGSVVAAYGITLAMYAGFGGATLAVLWQGISKTFGMSIGAASFVVALAMILFAAVYDRKQIHIGTVLYQIVYSGCVDLFANLHVYSGYAWINFFIMLLGVVLFAAGKKSGERPLPRVQSASAFGFGRAEENSQAAFGKNR